MSGTTKGIRFTGTYDRNEYFAENKTSSSAERRHASTLRGGSSAAGTADLRVGQFRIRPHRSRNNSTRTISVERDQSLGRVDIVPAVRFPFNKLAFLTFNTTAQFRNTFWTDSMLVNIVDGVEQATNTRLDAPISRRFVELSADMNGPTLVRIWDAQEHLRTAIPSLDRALRADSLPHRHRQLQRHPENREHGQHSRKRDVVQPMA